MSNSLKVLINAQVPTGGWWGGVEQFLMGLVWALGRLTDGDEEYSLIVSPQSPDWLKPLLGPNQKIVTAPPPKPNGSEAAKVLLGPLRRPAGKLWRASRRLLLQSPVLRAPLVPRSDGFLESVGGDVVHFPNQSFVACAIPSIYNPWDLQHLHFRQFFSDEVFAERETVYRAACHSARAVVAPSYEVKRDLVRHYGLDAHKVIAIHCAPPSSLYEESPDAAARQVRERLKLPDSFALFPAQTWPHKNHLRLLEALRLLRDRNSVTLNLVCPGRKNEYWPVIERRIKDLGLQAQVSFPGWVNLLESRALYHLAQFVVFPSLFEGAGMPVIEAFQEGVAVTCSDIPPLREYGDDAVLSFDPNSVESIAASLLRISRDEALRGELRVRGKERVRLFTWDRAGKTYRALYRRVAGVALSEEDSRLLSSETALSGSAPIPDCERKY